MTPPPRPDVTGIFDPATNTVSYIVADPQTGKAAIIDPVLDYDAASARTSTTSVDRLLEIITSRDLELVLALDTHAHADHLTGAHELRLRTSVPIGIGAHIDRVQKVFAPLFAADDVKPDASAFDVTYGDGDRFALGDLQVEVIHTPGHTPACVSYRIGDAVFVGDTLFMPDYGSARCDFPGGDARTLYRSIQKILSLPDDTRVFVGHDYLPEGRSDYLWESTVATQKARNIHIAEKNEDQFVAMREARDATLSAPRLILPSLQVNIRAGRMPPAEQDGRRFLKLPLNVI